MTAWCHLPTIFYRRRALLLAGLFGLCVAFITMLLFVHVSHAAPGTNKTIGFQGRLLSSAGAVVPDGRYNLQFKIYQDGTGQAAGNPDGTLAWTESYVNNNANTGVEVKNGYFSVSLGSVNPFGTSVDWNQDTLWLSINVAGSSGACTTFGTSPCTADGEMLPMKQMTATPYALNSNQLGGIGASGFIQNTTTPQTADFSISGTGTATTLQGNTSVIAPLFDRADAGTLNIGTLNASTLNIGSNNSSHTINIGNGSAPNTVSVGSTYGASTTYLQGGTGGIRLTTGGGFAVHGNGSSVDALTVGGNGDVGINVISGTGFYIHNGQSNDIFGVTENGTINTAWNTALNVNGTATFANGINLQGANTNTYQTPNGANLTTMINIPNYAVPAYGTILAIGLPSTSAATARGLMVADGRTGNHQATIGVLSPDENAIMGFSWNGSNSTGYLSNTANSLALQGNGLNLLTATNNGGQANVGIGNSATSGYALDVTGDTNTSSQYRINGTTALTNSSLAFSGASTSTITSAGGQSLSLDGNTGITFKNNGQTRASVNSTSLQVGTGSGSGQPTLLTLDKASSAPTVDSSLLGSMYYDTTLGKVQCYTATGWGTCGDTPDHFVTISPEYTNAVTHGTGLGTMSSDFCSDSLNINDGSSSQPTICGTNETRNFYKWTSAETSDQSKSIYVTYKLPSTFKEFASGTTSLDARTDSTDASATYQIYRSDSNGLTACGSAISASTGNQTTWQSTSASGSADPASCSFAAGDSIVFKINLTAKNNADAYVSDLSFTYR